MDLTRKTAFDVLLAIERDKAYSNLTLNRLIDERNIDNGPFVRELVYGVSENKIFLDYHLDRLIPSGIKKVKIKETVILRMGLYQLMFMNSVPVYAAVNESVNLARKVCRGREGFINGVLRGYLKRKEQIELPSKKENFTDYLSVKYSFPKWIINMWKSQFGEEILEELLSASNERPPLSIRINVMKTDRDSVKDLLTEKGFEVAEGSFSDRTLHVRGKGLLDLNEYKKGLFSVQDEASTLAADMLCAEEGETIVDVCAAPGGKTTAIAEKMNNRGHIIACDIYDHKLNIIRGQAERLGIEIIDTKLLDGIRGDEALDGRADKVIVDVPCSGLGVIRRKPEIKYKEAEDLSELVSIQKAIFKRSARYVKKGGIMIYSTCTVNREENESQTGNFLKNCGEFELIEQRQFLPTEGIDGFFVCKMIKKG